MKSLLSPGSRDPSIAGCNSVFYVPCNKVRDEDVIINVVLRFLSKKKSLVKIYFVGD